MVALAALPQTAQASPITYTLAGTGTGTFNAVAFMDQAFTINGIGDTAGFNAEGLSSQVPSAALVDDIVHQRICNSYRDAPDVHGQLYAKRYRFNIFLELQRYVISRLQANRYWIMGCD